MVDHLGFRHLALRLGRVFGSSRPGEKLAESGWVGVPGVLVFLSFFYLSRTHKLPDLLVGLAFAAALPFLLRMPSLPGPLARFFEGLAGFSYTIYLFHFSLAAFIWYSFFGAQRLVPSPLAFGRYVLVALLSVAYSFGVSLIFERNTGSVRRFLVAQLTGATPRHARGGPPQEK